MVSDLHCFISGVSTGPGFETFLYCDDDLEDCEDDLEDCKDDLEDCKDDLEDCKDEDCNRLASGIVSKLLASENAALELPPENELRKILVDLLVGLMDKYELEGWNPITESMQTWNHRLWG